MRVLIAVDLECVAGVASRQQTSPAGRSYDTACRLMTAEANAAVRGAFEGAATTVVVNDSHGRMDNLKAVGWSWNGDVEPVRGRPRAAWSRACFATRIATCGSKDGVRVAVVEPPCCGPGAAKGICAI